MLGQNNRRTRISISTSRPLIDQSDSRRTYRLWDSPGGHAAGRARGCRRVGVRLDEYHRSLELDLVHSDTRQVREPRRDTVHSGQTT